MITVSPTPEWKSAHAGGHVGVLVFEGIDNAAANPLLSEIKRETAERIRARYAGKERKDLLEIPVLGAYDRYYTQFKKTYHVQLQLESIAFKGKDFPSVSPLVDVNFVSEMDSLILTAGHDLDQLSGTFTIDVAKEGDSFEAYNGEPKAQQPGDMVMRDADGHPICSIIYGQEKPSLITPATRNVMYVSYAPSGVDQELTNKHFDLITGYLRKLYGEDLQSIFREVFQA